jgi:hypothetical protein
MPQAKQSLGQYFSFRKGSKAMRARRQDAANAFEASAAAMAQPGIPLEISPFDQATASQLALASQRNDDGNAADDASSGSSTPRSSRPGESGGHAGSQQGIAADAAEHPDIGTEGSSAHASHMVRLM